MTKDGLPGEASQEGQSRPVSLAGLVLVLCVALMGVMGVSITLPILPKLGAVFHQDAAGVALLITCFTLPSAFMTPVAGVLADRFGRKAVLSGCRSFSAGSMPSAGGLQSLIHPRKRSNDSCCDSSVINWPL